jgi:large subunit ribosomal protein L2
MGKRIRVQRRGRGTSVFRASTHKRIAPTHYPAISKEELEGVLHGNILEISHEPGSGSPLAVIKLENGQAYYSVVPEGVAEGQTMEIGSKASVDIGNVLPLGSVPEGTIVCNIELSPGDGGKIARSSGAYVTVIAHAPDGTMIKLPSGKTRYLNDLCRATVGVLSASGRTEKPWMKAGNKARWMRAKGHKYHMSRGVAMVSASHPYGSGRRGGRKITTVGRGAPPGQKVGLIAARSTGRGRKKRRI